MTDRWLAALDAARARWKGADPGERRLITAELDALWDELTDEEKRAATDDPNDEPVHCGPRHAHLGALLAPDPDWQARAFGAD